MKYMHPESKQEIDIDPASAWRYETQGWRAIAEDAPKGNGSLEDWQQYARSKGLADEDIADQSRDDLRAALA